MIIQKNEVLDFIYRRFPYSENGWNDNNTYYFAYILKSRFPQTIIYYNTLYKVFFAYIDNVAYNHHGIISYLNDDYVSKHCIDFNNMPSSMKKEITIEHII